MIIDTIHNKLDLVCNEAYNKIDFNLIEMVSFLRKSREIATLVFLARNSDVAFYSIVDMFGFFLDSYRMDDEEDGIKDCVWEYLLSSLLIVLVETDQVVATFSSIEALKEDAPPLLLVVARTYLLEGYHARSRICKSA